MAITKSEALFKEAVQYIPGGVNSPVRAFGSIGSTPRFIKKADKALMWDEDDNEYIDFIGSWGPMILGHNHPLVLDAVLEAAPPQPVSTPAHRARAVTAAASFLVSIFLIVLVLSCWINCGLNQTKGTGKRDEKRGPSVLRMA